MKSEFKIQRWRDLPRSKNHLSMRSVLFDSLLFGLISNSEIKYHPVKGIEFFTKEKACVARETGISEKICRTYIRKCSKLRWDLLREVPQAGQDGVDLWRVRKRCSFRTNDKTKEHGRQLDFKQTKHYAEQECFRGELYSKSRKQCSLETNFRRRNSVFLMRTVWSFHPKLSKEDAVTTKERCEWCVEKASQHGWSFNDRRAAIPIKAPEFVECNELDGISKKFKRDLNF